MKEDNKIKTNSSYPMELIKINELIKSGYAAMNPNGNIVDIREFPNAVKIKENKMFGVPKPKK